jgi:hypothetical protein
MRVLGLTGRRGSGKSSVAKVLADTYDFEILSFATPIKDMLSAMGIPDKYLHDPEFKEQPVPGYGKSGRYLMQTLGTEFGRHLVHPGVWVRAVKDKISKLKIDVVLDDVRFENEATMIHAYGGMIVRVERPYGTPPDEHRSELPLPEEHVDHTLRNVSPYESDLEYLVTDFMETEYNGTFHSTKPLGVTGQ